MFAAATFAAKGTPPDFNISGCNPQSFPHLRHNPADDRLINIAAGKKQSHMIA